MNNRQKMYIANSLTRKWLVDNGYKDIHLFPHTRWSKDIHFQGLEFDGCASLEKQFVLFQVKTNLKPTKAQLEQMRQVEKDSYVEILWFNKVNGKGAIEVYG
jgi:citrate lyase synthetase